MAAAAAAAAAGAPPPPPAPKSLAFSGDVTALVAVAPELARGDGGGVLLAGVGRRLCAFALPSGRRLTPLAGALPPGARVHGAAACAAPGGGAWVAAHGDRHAALFSLRDDGAGGAAWAPLVALPRQPAWTLAARLAPAPPPARGALLALGLADGSLAIYHIASAAAGGAAPAARLVRRAPGAAGRGTLWCMDLAAAPGAPPRVLVAAGSAAREVVVWAVDAALPAAGDAADDAGRLEAPRLEARAAAPPPPPPAALFRLAGHGGAVHGARWAPGGAALATCSDDRSLRLWDLSNLAAAARAREPPPTAVLAPRRTLFGHTARLWSACFAGGLVFSASEDGTWRAWEEESGACVAAVRAHGGRGAWRAAVAGGALYTGGADGAVRAWRLEDWLPAVAAARLGAPALRWALAPAPPLPPPPGAPAGGGGRAEWPRALALAPGGAVLYAGTNWGLLYRINLAPAGGPAVLPPPAGAPDSDSASTASAWRLLYASPRRSPFKSLALRCAPRGGAAVLAACDNDGHAVALRLGAGGAVAEAWDWRPAAPALGVFLGGGLPPGGAFVAGAAGRLALWALPRGAPAQLVAEGAAPLPGQVVALDVRLEGAAAAAAAAAESGDEDGDGWADADGFAALDALVATGGACGGVALWRLAGGTLAPLAAARRAHERAIVRGVRLAPRGAPAGLASCGGDGALRRHALRRAGAGVGAPWALALVAEEHCEGVPVLCGDSAGPAEGRAEDLDAAAAAAAADDKAGAGAQHAPRPRALFGFRDAWLVAWDARAACEAARVRCGGRRRPAAFAVAGPDDLTAAFLAGHSDGEREVMLYRRWPPPAGAPPSPARLLLPPLHGRPLAAAALLPLPGGGAALVSAGEDGALRQALWRSPPPGSPAGAGTFAAAALLAEHAAGTEPKALRALPLGRAAAPPRWLLVSAGSKRLLMAWELSAVPPPLCVADPAAPPLAAEWLATRAGAASSVRRGAAVADADHRCVALEAFFPAAALLPPGAGADAEALALVAAAAGDGSAELLALDRRPGAPTAARWRPVARLEHAAGLLLCLCHLEVAGAGGAAGAEPPPRHLLFAGGTDGSIVGWDLTAVARAFLAAFHSAAEGAAAAWALPALAPALAAPGAHLSGVNALAAAAPPGGAPPLLLSAGDDQALAAWALEERHGGALALRVGARVEGAHASALRGAWTDGAAALTAGADQRLRRWRVGAGGAALARAGCAVVQAAEPAALAAAALPGGALRVAVAGRGLELLEWPAT